MEPTPRSLILDLLGTVRRQSAPVRALLEAAALFSIGGNRLRVALARLCAQGLVERDTRGRYRLGAAASAVNEEIRAWPRLEDRRRAWDGGWIAVSAPRLSAASSRLRRNQARARALLGFRAFDAGLELRPDNLAGGIPAVRRRLAALDVESPGLVFGVRELDPAADTAARELFDRDGLIEGYRHARAAIETSAARLAHTERAQAMAESFRVGGRAIRQLVLDPLLPDEIVPGAERRRLIESMRDYDRQGRDIWSGWLGESNAETFALPAGVAPAPGLATLETT